ncbi:hypothetical protein [Mycolicibacterium komossense]|uniref:hypothetical protein n=1 Tax=Mycolicibacterium komossense TaxID=1779 RepID=UPI0021F2ED2D|nr:hypothetical protein [Mycolicibacterium komossense]
MKTKREVKPKEMARKGATRTTAAQRTARKPRGDEDSGRRGDAEIQTKGRAKGRRPAEAPNRGGRARNPKAAKVSGPTREPRGLQHGPATTPFRRPAPPKNTSQAKARAKARKAKAPKVVRVPLRERMLRRLSHVIENVELNPRTLAARVPFVVLVIAALGLGLGVTLWLSTDAAERSYQLGHARDVNQALAQQKEALERDVLIAQAPPALAEAARNLGMIPSRDTAHLVQDANGNWIVVGTPKPAEGVPPPPLNSKLPDDIPAPPKPAPPAMVNPLERPVRIPGALGAPGTDPEVLVRMTPPGAVSPLDHAADAVPGSIPGAAVPVAPGTPATGPLPGPVDAAGVPVAPPAAPAPVDVPAPAPADAAVAPAPGPPA